MRTVQMPRTAEELQALLDAAAAGEALSLQPGPFPPVAAPARFPVILGLMKGRITVPEWFDEPLPDDFMEALEGETTGPKMQQAAKPPGP